MMSKMRGRLYILPLLMVFIHTREGFSAECQPSFEKRGITIFNCSGSGLDSMPELPEQAQVLDFSSNHFKAFPRIPESRHCNYSCGVANTGSHCRLAVSFSNNNIDSFTENALHELRCLQTLDLSHNDIKADLFHPAFFEEGVYYLQMLNLRGNPLGRLPDNIITYPFMHDLRQLDLSHCQLQEIGRNSVDDFGQMKILDLSYNQLTSIHQDTFKVHGLTTNTMSSNVQNLIMDGMPLLTDLKANQLSSFPNLVSLSISNNKAFSKVHRKALTRDHSKLRHVRLEDNWLTTLESDALPWEQLDSLLLGQNPWLCDERLAWMLKASCIQGPVVCAGPDKLRGKDLRTLNPSDLKREVSIVPLATIILVLLAMPVVSACGVFVWRRRRFCFCTKRELQGRYVTVFTRDADEDHEAMVDLRLKTNADRIITISNGGADDTKHLVRLEKDGNSTAAAANADEEEEEI
ncbi:leucine rich repeat-containing domain protein [Plakobranchus ocellatus]|uniref:Leucine rich repeat-containing domain protein n=1 Tax=Plakobranchus ocellatus TaxID=259542 RepID=A0AAV4C8N4_9GAST|nr:leucine rich repeat-containing domain protein [Plakobranchus ocellatus]